MLRVTDLVTGNDITSRGDVEDATLMIFDQQGNYLAHMEVEKEQLGTEVELPPQVLTRSTGQTLQISAWGNLDENVAFQEEYGAGHNLQSEFLALRANTEYIDNWHSPGDLFFGLTTITLGSEHVHTVSITQKTARMAVTVRGLPAGDRADDYYFSMCEQNDGFTFDGTPLRQNPWCKIREKGVFDASGDFTTDEPYYVIPSTDPDDPTACNAGVCLYKVGGQARSTRALTSDQAGYVTEEGDTNITGKARVDSSGNHLALAAGQTTNVLITFNPSGDIEIQVEMTAWNEVYQWESW